MGSSSDAMVVDARLEDLTTRTGDVKVNTVLSTPAPFASETFCPVYLTQLLRSFNPRM